MSLWQRLTNAMSKTKKMQEELDVETALVLTTWYKRVRAQGAATAEQIEADADMVTKRSHSRQVKNLQRNLDEQVTHMFKTIHETRATVPPARRAPVRARFSPAAAAAQTSVLPGEEAKPVDPHAPILAELRKRLGFTVSIGPSKIANAGRGVFIDGSALTGSVIAFFPGMVYAREHQTDEQEISKLFPDPELLMTQRFDKVLIDSRAQNPQQYNEYALAHLCNHGQPNCLSVAYDFAQDPLGWSRFPIELRKYIPNWWVRPRTLMRTHDQSAWIHTVLLIALQDLKDGDEILVNYRLNPRFTPPSWYQIIDEEQVQRRWS